MKHQVLFSLKNNENIFMNVICCSCDWRFKGLEPGLYPGVLGRGFFFAKIGKETGHLGIKIAGVSCKIWEFCLILKKLQLGMGPVSGPCETRDKEPFICCPWYHQDTCTCVKVIGCTAMFFSHFCQRKLIL